MRMRQRAWRIDGYLSDPVLTAFICFLWPFLPCIRMSSAVVRTRDSSYTGLYQLPQNNNTAACAWSPMASPSPSPPKNRAFRNFRTTHLPEPRLNHPTFRHKPHPNNDNPTNNYWWVFRRFFPRLRPVVALPFFFYCFRSYVSHHCIFYIPKPESCSLGKQMYVLFLLFCYLDRDKVLRWSATC